MPRSKHANPSEHYHVQIIEGDTASRFATYRDKHGRDGANAAIRLFARAHARALGSRGEAHRLGAGRWHVILWNRAPDDFTSPGSFEIIKSRLYWKRLCFETSHLEGIA